MKLRYLLLAWLFLIAALHNPAGKGSFVYGALIDLAAARGAYIDQSQSLNLFMANPTIGQLSSMYMYAWKSGIKTTYYLRSRPATHIAKTTVQAAPVSDTAAVVCSLENPETCEACQ